MWSKAIGKAVVINTNDDIGKERMPVTNMELNRIGISYSRVEAIKDADGAVGLLKTMHKLFHEYNHSKSLLVFEDDVKILREDFNDIMGQAMAQLPEDFDCLYLGCNLLVPPIKHSDNLYKIKAAYSSHAILYSKKAIDLILSLWSESVPYDNFLMMKVQPYGNCFCVNPLLCSQRKGVSSIFEYKPHMIGMEKYYDFGTKEIDWGLMMEERYNERTKNL